MQLRSNTKSAKGGKTDFSLNQKDFYDNFDLSKLKLKRLKAPKQGQQSLNMVKLLSNYDNQVQSQSFMEDENTQDKTPKNKSKKDEKSESDKKQNKLKKRKRVYTLRKRKIQEVSEAEIEGQIIKNCEEEQTTKQESVATRRNELQNKKVEENLAQECEPNHLNFPDQQVNAQPLQQQNLIKDTNENTKIYKDDSIERTIDMCSNSFLHTIRQYDEFCGMIPQLRSKYGYNKARHWAEEAKLDAMLYDPNFDMKLQSELTKFFDI